MLLFVCHFLKIKVSMLVLWCANQPLYKLNFFLKLSISLPSSNLLSLFFVDPVFYHLFFFFVWKIFWLKNIILKKVEYFSENSFLKWVALYYLTTLILIDVKDKKPFIQPNPDM